MAEEKSNTFRNVMIIIFISLIVGLILFVVYQSKIKTNTPDIATNPDGSINLGDINQSGLSEEEIIQIAKEQLLKQNNLVGDEDSNSTFWVVIIFLILIGVGTIIYIHYFKNNDEETQLKQPVAIDKIQEIFKEKIAKKYGLAWYIDDGKFKLSDEKEFYYRDQRIWFERQTGDKFLLVEFVLNNGPFYGLHTANIPADKGEKLLWEGEWTLKHRKDMEDFKLMPRTYPVTSVEDKRERQQMYIAEQVANGEISKDSVNSFQNQNNQQMQQGGNKTSFVSPFSSNDDALDHYGDEAEDDGEAQSQASTMSQPRSRTNYNKRYKK